MGLNAHSTLAGFRATSARIRIPAWGCWFADVALDGEHVLKGNVELVVADLVMQGAVLSGGVRNGRSFYRVAAGAGRWGKTVAARSYATDAGVKLSTVVTDAAKDCGESIDAASLPRDTVGPAFVRTKNMASRVLELVAASNWYVGEDGVTRVGRRPRREFSGKATRVTTVPDQGSITLASESLKELVPGIVVDGLEAVDVEHEVNAKGGVRSTLWGNVGDVGAGDASRPIAAIRKIVDQLTAPLRYFASWEYRVVSLSGKRLNLQPNRAVSGMPTLLRVPVRAGIPGIDITPRPGAMVLVQFVDGLPSRPYVAHFEDPEGAGFDPLKVKFTAVAEIAIDAAIVKLGLGARPVIAAGDLAGGLFPVVPTQPKVFT